MVNVLRWAVLPVLALGPPSMVPVGAVRPAVRIERVAVSAPGRVELPFPATHLALRWRGEEEAGVEVRLPMAGSVWQPVQVADDVSDPTTGDMHSGLLLARGAEEVEVRALPGRVAGLAVVAIDAAGTTSAPPALRTSGPRTGEAASEPPGRSRVADPAVVTRAGWGADESQRRGTPQFAPVSKLVVHHTVTPNDDPDPAATVRAIYAYHTRERGWNDIAYHFLVDAQGRIYEGRYARSYRPGETPNGEDEEGRGVIGAHARDTNTGSVGVALLGTFVDAAPSEAALRSLERVLAWKAQRHGIDVRGADPYTGVDGRTRTFPNLSGHRDVGSTECPGGRLYDALPGMRERVAHYVDTVEEALPEPGPTPGYWIVGREGDVQTFGAAREWQATLPLPRLGPAVALAPTRSGRGYWLLDSAGGVQTFGDARLLGSVPGQGIVGDPMVDLVATESGEGYWLLDAGGGVHPYGDARLLGSLADTRLAAPVVAMGGTPTGQGYWLAAADGGVFAFGDAPFLCSLAGAPLAAPIVALEVTPSGQGYWLAAADGGVFAFGDAPFLGRAPEHGAPLVALRATVTGRGYYTVAADGSLGTLGDARALPPSGPAPADETPEVVSSRRDLALLPPG